MNMTELDRTFESLARDFLVAHPEIQHEWREARSGDRLDLICGVGTATEVFASLLGYQIALGLTLGEHEDFEDFGRGLAEEEVAREAFARFTDLLRLHGHLNPTT
jgi:hypothetical protein